MPRSSLHGRARQHSSQKMKRNPALFLLELNLWSYCSDNYSTCQRFFIVAEYVTSYLSYWMILLAVFLLRVAPWIVSPPFLTIFSVAEDCYDQNQRFPIFDWSPRPASSPSMWMPVARNHINLYERMLVCKYSIYIGFLYFYNYCS